MSKLTPQLSSAELNEECSPTNGRWERRRALCQWMVSAREDTAISAIDVRTVFNTAGVEHPIVFDCAERDAVVAAACHRPAFEFDP
jgi:hypothetical protein